MRTSPLALVSLVLLALLAAPTAADDTTVVLRELRFDPPDLEISAGETVVWEHQDGTTGHTVTFEDGSFDSHPSCNALILPSCLQQGESVQRTFAVTGAYAYFCSVHRDQGMTGQVVVAGGSTTTAGTVDGSTSTTLEAATTTSTTEAPTTTTSRELATSSTLDLSTSTTTAPRPPAEPNEPPYFDPGSSGEFVPGEGLDAEPPGDELGAQGAPSDGGGGGGAAVLVIILLGVALGGSLLLWRMRPRRTPS